MTDDDVSAAAAGFTATRRVVDHPVITRCAFSSPGLPGFVEGSPFVLPERLAALLAAMRDDVSLMSVEPAPRVFRHPPRGATYPLPESCTPYLDANSSGYQLAPVLPIVFVRTRRGEPLLEARVALKYLYENASRFGTLLESVEEQARAVFRPDAYAALRSRRSPLIRVVQPYSAFTDRHVSLRCGFWVATPTGVSTAIGPLVNRAGPVSVMSGAIETDWHHFELFVVIELPQFDGPVMVIDAGTPIAQLHFVARACSEATEICFSPDDPGADPHYGAAWERLGGLLVEAGRTTVAERTGTGSVQLGCPHCYVSVTAAAEQPLPAGHVFRRGFNPAYRVLKRAFAAGRQAPDHT